MSDRDALFVDRVEAGRVLARHLETYRGSGALVLGIPRGGVVVAAAVARELGLELDVAVARKLGAPGQQELAIGAVTADGGVYVNRALVEACGISEVYIAAATAAKREEARRREQFLRAGRPAATIAGRDVIVVDDGLATGATARAACLSVRRAGPKKLILAVPVGSLASCIELREVADEVVCPDELEYMVAIGYHYVRFEPVEDETVKQLLQSNMAAGAPGRAEPDDAIAGVSRGPP